MWYRILKLLSSLVVSSRITFLLLLRLSIILNVSPSGSLVTWLLNLIWVRPMTGLSGSSLKRSWGTWVSLGKLGPLSCLALGQFHMLSFSIENRLDTLNRVGHFNKAIPYLHTCSYYVLWVLKAFCIKLNLMGWLGWFQFVEIDLVFLTFYLWMTVFYSVELKNLNVNLFLIYWLFMKRDLDRKLIETRQTFFFFQLKHSPGRANSYTETFKCPLPLRNIWGPLPLLEELKNRVLSILKKVFGKSLKVRKKSFYLKLEGG